MSLSSQQTCIFLHNLRQLYSDDVSWMIMEYCSCSVGEENDAMVDGLFNELGKERIFQINQLLAEPAFSIKDGSIVHEKTRRVLYIYSENEAVPSLIQQEELASKTSQSKEEAHKTCSFLLEVRQQFSPEIAWKVAEIGVMRTIPSVEVASALYNLLTLDQLQQMNTLFFMENNAVFIVRNEDTIVYRDPATATEYVLNKEQPPQQPPVAAPGDDQTRLSRRDLAANDIYNHIDNDNDDSNHFNDDNVSDITDGDRDSLMTIEEYAKRQQQRKFLGVVKRIVWSPTKFVVKRTASCVYMGLVGPMQRKRLTNIRRKLLTASKKNNTQSSSLYESQASGVSSGVPTFSVHEITL